MAITINVTGVNSGGGNQQPPANPTPYTPPSPTPQPQSQPYQPSNNWQQPVQPQQPQQPIRYQRPDFNQFSTGKYTGAIDSVLPTSERMVNDVRAEISRRGIILVPGTQNFSTILNTLRQNQKTANANSINQRFDDYTLDVGIRYDSAVNEIKRRIEESRQSELAGITDPTIIAAVNKRWDKKFNYERERLSSRFDDEMSAASQERDSQIAESENRLAEAMQRLTEELSQGNKDSYLNNLRDKYKEQIWRRDNATTEEEVREASREAAKIQERMQRGMSASNPNLQRWLGVAGTIATTAISTGVQLDRIGIQQGYIGLDMASSVLNGNAFAAIRQENALKEQRNSAIYNGIGMAGGALVGAAIGSAFGGVGAIPGYVIGGLLGGLAGTGVGTLGSHLANRSMFVEDERTRVADLWRQEEGRITAFNDLVMLTRGRFTNPKDISGIRRLMVESSGERPFTPPAPQEEDFVSSVTNSVISYVKNAITPTLSGWQPSDSVKRDITFREGAAMYKSTYDPNLRKMVGKNKSFEEVAEGFVGVLPDDIREKVLSNRELADNLYSYAYNVGTGNFRKRVVPALQRYYEGKGSVDEITSSMWAEGDKDPNLGGLRKRRAKERAGVRRALRGETSGGSSVSADYDESPALLNQIWRKSGDYLDIYDLGYTAPEFAQQAARRIKQRGFISDDALENAFYGDALERVFSLNSGTLGQLSIYDRFGRNNANQDFVNLAYTLDRLGTTGMRQGAWARSDEFAGYMTQLQQGQRSTFLTVDNARVGRQIATGQDMFGNKFGAEALQGIQQVNNTIQNPKGGFAQTLLYDVIQELFPNTRGRIDLIEQAQYDPTKQNEIQQEYQRRIQSIYGGVDTTAGYLAAQEIWGIQNPNVMMPIVEQLGRKGGLEAQRLDRSHKVSDEVAILNNGYTPEVTQKTNAMADQQMKSLLHYQETITEVVQNILDKIETSVVNKLQEAVDNLK